MEGVFYRKRWSIFRVITNLKIADKLNVFYRCYPYSNPVSVYYRALGTYEIVLRFNKEKINYAH